MVVASVVLRLLYRMAPPNIRYVVNPAYPHFHDVMTYPQSMKTLGGYLLTNEHNQAGLFRYLRSTHPTTQHVVLEVQYNSVWSVKKTQFYDNVDYAEAIANMCTTTNTGGTVFAIAIPYANPELQYTIITGGGWR